MDKVHIIRNPYGLTLPFALILTFIFSALVGVSYLFVSVNLYQMQSSLQSLQAESIAEGVNEKIKARLNTKSKIPISPKQEKKLKSSKEEDDTGDSEDDEDLSAQDEFDENSEDFDEYYADEVLKISRYITFREPKKNEADASGNQIEGKQSQNNTPPNPLENVEMLGSIDVPTGTVFAKGVMIVVYKEEIVGLMLKDIIETGTLVKAKLPIPIIKSLSPNYAESDSRAGIVVIGDNLGYDQKVRFSNKNITIEDIKAGPTIQTLIGPEVTPGITYLYWNNVRTEFYIVPSYDGSPRPEISDVKTSDGNQLISAKAGQKRLNITINGANLFFKKNPPVVVPDVVGIIPKVQSQSENGTQIVVTLDIDTKVEPGVHSLAVATEGGLSNSWVFSVLPPEKMEDLSGNIAKVSSSLTLLDVRVVDNLLPIIGEDDNQNKDPNSQGKQSNQGNKNNEDEEISEGAKLSAFANVDLETVWLLETTAKVGNTTKTVSEVVNRELPNIHAALITNGKLTLDGGGYQITSLTSAMTTLTEPTYISNTVLMVEGPPEEPEESIQSTGQTQDPNRAQQPSPIKSPTELGFTPGSLVTIFMDGARVGELDYAVIKKVGRDTIELITPGLMGFHYENDQVYQFIPPVISGEKIDEATAEKHIVPKELAISIPNYANEQTIFRSNIEQFAELADLYTNDPAVPKDEYDIPIGYMGLTYIDGTPVYDKANPLTGKGVLIIDTRGDNQGRPIGQVEISGDSKSQSDFSGIVYIKGNLRIEGNANIHGALIVDNDQRGTIQIADSALGKINYDEKSIRQSLLSTPFTTKAGSIMIANKSINLKGYIQKGTGTPSSTSPGAVGTSSGEVTQPQPEAPQPTEKQPEEALVEESKEEKGPGVQTIQIQPQGGKSAEEELIDLF